MTSEINKNLAILGLRPGAKQIEIKNAFRNLSLIYHPDNKETGSARKFIEIKAAYDALFDKVLFEKELKDLKEDPEAYYRARAKFPIVFEEEDEKGGTNSTNTNTRGNTYSSTAVKPYVSKPKTPYNSKPKTTTSTPPKKKNNDGGDIVPFCIGGLVVAAIFALLSFPPLLLIVIIGAVAYWLLK